MTVNQTLLDEAVAEVGTPFGEPKLSRFLGSLREVVINDVVLFGLVAACVMFLAYSGLQSDATVRIAAIGLVLLPYVSAITVAYTVAAQSRNYVLAMPEYDDASWRRVKETVKDNWRYEGYRYGRSLAKLKMTALIFGAATAVALTFGFGSYWWAAQARLEILRMMALSWGVAAAGSFAITMSRLRARLAANDVSPRMFAWALQSLVLVIIGDMLIVLVTYKQGVTSGVSMAEVGLVAAVLGDKLVQLVLDKAAGMIGLKLPASVRSSPLLTLDGISGEDVERFAEEGIVSLADLAFIPTARLFFDTNRSMQHICDWQDQALLRVYLGDVRAKNLFDQMGIRGAIDLQAVACELLARFSIENAAPPPPPPDERFTAIGKALSMEGAALRVALGAFAYDEPTRRLRIYWDSTPNTVAASAVAPAVSQAT